MAGNNHSLEKDPDWLTFDHFPGSTDFIPYSIIFKTSMLCIAM